MDELIKEAVDFALKLLSTSWSWPCIVEWSCTVTRHTDAWSSIATGFRVAVEGHESQEASPASVRAPCLTVW